MLGWRHGGATLVIKGEVLEETVARHFRPLT